MENNDYKIRYKELLIPVIGAGMYEERQRKTPEGKFEDPRAELRHSLLDAGGLLFCLATAAAFSLQELLKKH